MSKIVLKNPIVTVNAIDLSDHISSVSLDIKYDTISVEAFGSTGKEYVAGLQDSQITMTLHQDFASSSVEATLWPLLGTTTTVTVKPVTGTTTTSNPLYTMTALVSEHQPVTGKVGELVAPSLTWKVSGSVTRTTT